MRCRRICGAIGLSRCAVRLFRASSMIHAWHSVKVNLLRYCAVDGVAQISVF